jgi:acetyl-CoA acetyltransferase
MMNKAYVAGIEMTRFAKTPHLKVEKMGREAVLGAVKDAGIEINDIQEVYCGNVFVPVGPGQKIMTEVGHTGIPITNLENACASGSNAFREAYLAVACGRIDVCLAVGVENLSSVFSGALQDESDLEGAQGLTFPSLYALRARRYMHEYGLKPEHLAKISVKNRKNAYYNERSKHGELIDVDTVLNSPMIVDPLRLYDCNPVSDGGAAAVIVSEKTSKKLGKRCVEIVASSLVSGKLEHGFIDMTFEDMTHRAAQDCYHQSGCGPEDIDFAEVHDCFTIAEILRVESMGFCERGGYVGWIEDGTAEINGKKPINPSGGLLGKGHPLGATGIAQIYEICRQLRGEAGQRQISDPNVGLAMCRGGTTIGIEGNACAMHVLKSQ